MQSHSAANKWFRPCWTKRGIQNENDTCNWLNSVRAIQRLHDDDCNKHNEAHQDTVFEHEIGFLHVWNLPFFVAKTQQHRRHITTEIRSFTILGVVTIFLAMTRKQMIETNAREKRGKNWGYYSQSEFIDFGILKFPDWHFVQFEGHFNVRLFHNLHVMFHRTLHEILSNVRPMLSFLWKWKTKFASHQLIWMGCRYPYRWSFNLFLDAWRKPSVHFIGCVTLKQSTRKLGNLFMTQQNPRELVLTCVSP